MKKMESFLLFLFCVFRLNLLYNDVDVICERYYEQNTASNETKTTTKKPLLHPTITRM